MCSEAIFQHPYPGQWKQYQPTGHSLHLLKWVTKLLNSRKAFWIWKALLREKQPLFFRLPHPLRPSPQSTEKTEPCSSAEVISLIPMWDQQNTRNLSHCIMPNKYNQGLLCLSPSPFLPHEGWFFSILLHHLFALNHKTNNRISSETPLCPWVSEWFVGLV